MYQHESPNTRRWLTPGAEPIHKRCGVLFFANPRDVTLFRTYTVVYKASAQKCFPT